MVTVEEGSIGGFASHVMQFLALNGLLDGGLKFRPMTLPDRYAHLLARVFVPLCVVPLCFVPLPPLLFSSCSDSFVLFFILCRRAYRSYVVRY